MFTLTQFENLPWDLRSIELVRYLPIKDLFNYFILRKKYLSINRDPRLWIFLIKRDYRVDYQGIYPSMIYRAIFDLRKSERKNYLLAQQAMEEYYKNVPPEYQSESVFDSIWGCATPMSFLMLKNLINLEINPLFNLILGDRVPQRIQINRDWILKFIYNSIQIWIGPVPNIKYRIILGTGSIDNRYLEVSPESVTVELIQWLQKWIFDPQVIMFVMNTSLFPNLSLVNPDPYNIKVQTRTLY